MKNSPGSRDAFALRRYTGKLDPNLTAGIVIAFAVVLLAFLPHTTLSYVLSGAIALGALIYVVQSIRHSVLVTVRVEDDALVESMDGVEHRLPFSELRSLKAAYSTNRYWLRVRRPSPEHLLFYQPLTQSWKDRDQFSSLAYSATQAYKAYKEQGSSRARTVATSCDFETNA